VVLAILGLMHGSQWCKWHFLGREEPGGLGQNAKLPEDEIEKPSCKKTVGCHAGAIFSTLSTK